MTPFFYNGGSDPRNVKIADKVTKKIEHFHFKKARGLSETKKCFILYKKKLSILS